MAEIEMEVDVAPQYATGPRLDDDLIDYDTEAERELNYENNPEMSHDELLYAEENAVSAQQTHEDVEYFEQQEDEQSDTAYVQIESDALEQTSPGHELSHEIDYDAEDVSDLPIADDASEIRGLAAGEEDLDDVSRAEYTLDGGEAGDPTAIQAEDQEITWEHEHDEFEKNTNPVVEDSGLSTAASDQFIPNHSAVPPVAETDDRQQEQQLEQELESEQELELEHEHEHEHEHELEQEQDHEHEHEHEQDKQQDQVPLDFAEMSGYAHNSIHDEDNDEGLDEYEIVQEDAANDREVSDTDSLQYPAITVQYKGDEFPCFSANSDGFFSQMSLLDESIKSVLEAFREELTNELLAEDELVFQVDELGLEFSESCSPDLLANITLRQIIEIFDVLVKNQDPDNIRPLYTYLFTRPSTSKRLDFLMESAAEGKGLDEVIHLFQGPMTPINGADTGIDSALDEDIATQLDDIESAYDGDSTEANHVLDVSEPNDQTNEVDANDEEAPRQPEVILENSPTGTDESRHLKEEEMVVSDAVAVEDDVGDGQEVVEEAKEDEREAPFVASGSILPANDAGNVIIRSKESEDTAAVAITAVELERSEADDILGIDFDEPVDSTGINGADAGQDEVEQQDLQIDEMDAGVDEAGTTTAPLKDHVDTSSAPVGFDAVNGSGNELNGSGNELIPMDEANEEVDEIDWRDEPETLVDDFDGDTSPTTAKRARCDDENDAGDDQNVKRRRP
ncbi:hypothetical protein E4U21_002465 [Claviceps maximensis]|nr:hypothetical protein E4U21_002465 [Claviceps maximensis]